VEFCFSVSLQHVYLGGDALQMVNVVKSFGRIWNRFGQLVEDILGVLTLFSSRQIGHVKRKCNRATHILANEAVRYIRNETWQEAIPHCIYDTVMS
jgi:hypothetical protein